MTCLGRDALQCDQVAEMLREEGIRAKPFHRGLKNPELDKTMQQWLDGGVECVVLILESRAVESD